jgi:hypothetical protein
MSTQNLFGINLGLEAVKFNLQVDANLDGKIRNLLTRMNSISDSYNDVNTLSNVLLTNFDLKTNLDNKDGVTSIDFEGSEFQILIDRLYDKEILTEVNGRRIYKFETKQEIERFKTLLEGIQNKLKNEGQEPSLLIQPLLNLLDLMNRIAKSCIEQQEKLEEATQRIR